MMPGPAIRVSSGPLIPSIAACACLFLAANIALIGKAWFLDGYRLILVLSIPLSQCSLASIWAGRSRAPLPLRFAVPTFAWGAAWCVLARNLNWGIGEDAAAAWSVGLAVQTMVVSIAVVLQQRFASHTNMEGKPCVRKPILRLSIGSLILWTAVIALGFAFHRYGQRVLGWNATSSNWEFRIAILSIGLFNACIALLWSWAMEIERTTPRRLKIAVAAGLVGLGAILLPRAIEWIAGVSQISVGQSLTLAAGQTALLTCSLLSLTYRRNREQDSFVSAPSVAKPR